MIISKTPLRMSFVGGGSDLPSFYKEHGGAVISTALNKYVYVMAKSRFEEGIRLSYSKTENVMKSQDLKHPIVKHAIDMIKYSGNIEIVSMADIPSSGTGLGSSSSFSCGLIKTLLAHQGHSITAVSLAARACELEIDRVGSPIGKQDQYAAAIGGFNVYRFNSDDSVTIEPVLCSSDNIKQLEKELLVFYIGGERDANKILATQSKDLETTDKAKAMKKMINLVDDLKYELESGAITSFGDILHENWMLKKNLSSGISSSSINEIYETAIKAGAKGGKLLGAGGGGFMIFHVPDHSSRERVKLQFSKLKEVDFKFESKGSSIIYNEGN